MDLPEELGMKEGRLVDVLLGEVRVATNVGPAISVLLGAEFGE